MFNFRVVSGKALAAGFEVARLDVFQAKGPFVYLAQANGLGDTQTRD